MVKSAYTIDEVADYFKVSTRTIRIWLKKDGSFPRPFKKFGTLRFSRDEIERYWEDNLFVEDYSKGMEPAAKALVAGGRPALVYGAIRQHER